MSMRNLAPLISPISVRTPAHNPGRRARANITTVFMVDFLIYSRDWKSVAQAQPAKSRLSPQGTSQRLLQFPLFLRCQLLAAGGDIEDVDGFVRFRVNQHHVDARAARGNGR